MKEILPLVAFVPFAVGLLLFVVNCALAAGVARESQKLGEARVPLYALDRNSWIFVVLLTGLLGFLAFWAIHHSALKSQVAPKT